MQVIMLYRSKLRQLALDEQLRSHDVEVVCATSINSLLCFLRERLPDAVLLEDCGPILSDWLAILALRAGPDLPVLVIGGPKSIGIVEALAQGASDYIDHDMPVDQLVSRLRAHATKRGVSILPVSQVGSFILSDLTMTIRHESSEISLTTREYALARILFGSIGRVVPLGSLSVRIWGTLSDVSKRTLEQHIYKLRRKLETHFSNFVRIQAAYGIGYRLDLITPTPEIHYVSKGGLNPTASSHGSSDQGRIERRKSNYCSGQMKS